MDYRQPCILHFHVHCIDMHLVQTTMSSWQYFTPHTQNSYSLLNRLAGYNKLKRDVLTSRMMMMLTMMMPSCPVQMMVLQVSKCKGHTGPSPYVYPLHCRVACPIAFPNCPLHQPFSLSLLACYAQLSPKGYITSLQQQISTKCLYCSQQLCA